MPFGFDPLNFGNIKHDEYENLTQGLSPCGRYALARKTGKDHTPGWDLTCSAPKSFSLLWARADHDLRQALSEAQHQASVSTLAVLEKNADVTRRGKNGYRQEKVEGFVAAAFEHVNSREQDPQIHTHMVLMNVAPRADGSWGTLHSRPLYFWAKTGSALYRAELAKQLRNLGIATEIEGDAFHISGVDKNLCEHFSKRGAQIKKALADAGLTSSACKAGDIITLDTRSTKENIDRPTLIKTWQKTMDEHGFTAEKLKSLPKLEPPALCLDQEKLLEDLTSERSIFTEQNLYRLSALQALETGDGIQGVTRFSQAVLQHEEVVDLGLDRDHNRIFSTQSMLTLERKMVRQARQLSQQKGFSIPKEQLSQLSQQHGLTQEQTKGLEHACNDSGFNALLGSAGVGKTRLMLAVNQAYQENGFKIIGTTIAKVAADQLAKESGITSFTTAKLLTDIESGRLALDNKSVVVVDEAGQQGVRQLEALITAVRQAGSKLICVGDQEQLDAIELGGSLRFLSNSLGCHRMTRIQRQDEEWARQAVMSFRDGQALDALKTHAEHKQLHFSDSADASKDLLIKQWQAYQSDGKTSIVLAQRWADVKGLNERIRAIYQEQGTVGQQNIERECVVSDRSITFAFSVGERIKFTKNDYRKNLSNGLLGTVESITELEDGDLAFVILADDGRKVHFNASEYSDDQGRLQLAQAYSLTLYSSQGVTVDNTFIYHTPSMDRANTYVAASRHRSDCHFYMNDAALRELSESGRNGDIMDSNERLQTLAKLMSTDRHQRLAIDYLPANEREPEQQLKQEKHEELEMA